MSVLLACLRQIIPTIPFSLRLQVAMWYTLSFVFLLLLTGAGFYQYLETALDASIDTDLQIRSQQIASDLVIEHGTLILHTITQDLPGVSSTTSQQNIQPADVNYGVMVRILDAHGTQLFETPAFRNLLVPGASITKPLKGAPWQGTVMSKGEQEVRLYSRTLTVQGKPIAVIQVGESLDNLSTLLHRLVAVLFVVGFIVLLFCAVGSYWLAGRSFTPIKRLVETARKIKAGDLHQRVPVPVVRDEVQYLAITLNEMLESLDQSFTRQRRFVADASHELRTPVAVIRNKASVALLDTPTLLEATAALQEIRSETERLSLLLTDLLTLARGDEGQARFEREVVDFDRLVETVAATTEVLAAERNIQLTVQTPHPLTVVGDEARLIQVVMNLLDNAIHYTPSGGRIYISVEQTKSEVCLQVRDTGIGISPEHLPHIFERFYRVDSARSRTEGGNSGLGLSIVEWIVRAHNGSISVESAVGHGSCFTVRLPIRNEYCIKKCS